MWRVVKGTLSDLLEDGVGCYCITLGIYSVCSSVIIGRAISGITDAPGLYPIHRGDTA